MKSIYGKHISVIPAQIKDVDGKKGIIAGYFSVFNNEDSDGDTIMPGAFTKTIMERGPQSAQPRIKHLLNHNVYEPVGNLLVLKEDTKGLYYESQPGTHALGLDTVKMIESGLITEHSFGFETVKKSVINPDADWRDRKTQIHELKMWEGSSLTAWGANELTGAAVMKQMGKEAYLDRLIKQNDALAKFCRTSSATDETIEMLLLHSKQLTQAIFDLQNTTQPVETTVPDNSKELFAALKQFNNSLTTK